MNNVIVIGGSGYIGSECLVQLLDRGYRVINIDLNYSKVNTKDLNAKGELHTIICDMSSEIPELKVLRPLLHGDPTIAIICFGAWKDLSNSIFNPTEYYRNNLGVTINSLELAQTLNADKFIFSSSAAVYPDCMVGEVEENDSAMPNTPYGRTKLMGEAIVNDQSELLTITGISLRYFNPIGKTSYSEDNSDSLFGSIKYCLETGATAEIFGDDYATEDGTCYRDFIDLRDLVDAHIFCIENSVPSGVYNVGTGVGTTIKQVMEAVKSVNENFVYTIGKRRLGDSLGCYANITKLSNYGWKPKYNLIDSIKTLL